MAARCRREEGWWTNHLGSHLADHAENKSAMKTNCAGYTARAERPRAGKPAGSGARC